MASKSFLNQFNDLDFTYEEQGAVFIPTIPWDSLKEDSHLIIIGKLISSNTIDDNAVVRAFQGIWKHDKVVSIILLKPSYYRIKFPTEDIQNDILARGPWTFKDDWLAIAALNPEYSIDDYTFLTMNVWIRIHGIPSVLMDDDDNANHTGHSLGNMIGEVVKVDTRRIDLNMIDYLRIGIILDVTKPVHRCVAIEGSGPFPKLFPLQYERLPTLCHGCGIIGHALEHCSTFKPEPNSKLQYGDWLRYIPTKKQEPQPRSKGSIRYLAGVNNTKPKNAVIGTSSSNPRPTTTDPLLQTVAAAETTTGLVLPVNAIDPIGPSSAKDTTMDAVTDPNVTTIKANDTKLAAATASVVSNLLTTNVELVPEMFPTKGDASDPIIAPTSPVDVTTTFPMGAILDSSTTETFGSTMVPTPINLGGPDGFIDFLNNPIETSTKVPYLLDNLGLDAAPINLLPLPREEGLDYELGKSFLATSTMLIMFDARLSNKSSSHIPTIDKETPLTISRGAKRRLSMQHDSKTKKPRCNTPSLGSGSLSDLDTFGSG
ncbi:hypothetical protein V6N11_031787 [Hibiscus sabdariffa]|uniref:DUF4283 domain-containing protein n=1 Tax=Hibiscus sabdariffa TaxID=183260 RepID=A0ABR2SYP0_9ROSI